MPHWLPPITCNSMYIKLIHSNNIIVIAAFGEAGRGICSSRLALAPYNFRKSMQFISMPLHSQLYTLKSSILSLLAKFPMSHSDHTTSTIIHKLYVCISCMQYTVIAIFTVAIGQIYLINQNLNFIITCFLTYLFKLRCQFSKSLTQIFKYMHTQVGDFLYKRRHDKSVYVTGPAKIDHVSTNYTELYFY